MLQRPGFLQSIIDLLMAILTRRDLNHSALKPLFDYRSDLTASNRSSHYLL
jgi:hypothetical protein